jgi:hypothetical protein
MRRARSGRAAIARSITRAMIIATSSGFSSSRSIKRRSLAVGSGTGRAGRIVLRGAQRKAQPSRGRGLG